MYSLTTTLEVAGNAVGEHRAYFNLDHHDPASSSALRSLIGASGTLQFIEYDCMVEKLNEGTQEKEPDVEKSTFSMNGRPYDLDKLMGLPVLAQRLKTAVPACAHSDSALRKVLVLISEVTDKVYLWREQVMCSFEELIIAVCGDLYSEADELHDPTWTGRFQEQPEHVKAIVCFQDKVLDVFQDLLQILHRPNEDMLDVPNYLLLMAFYQNGYKAAGLSPDGDVSFQAMLLFCTVVPADMKQQASLVLDECFEDSDPQTSAGPSEDYTSDEGQSGQEDKAASKLLRSKRFMYEACVDCLQHRAGKHADDSAAAGVNSADETSCSNSQESNSAEDDDVSLESVD